TDHGEVQGGLQLLRGHARGASISCMHSELGYANTFRRVASALVESFELETPHVAPQFTEVHTVRLAGKPVGVSFTEMTRGKDVMHVVSATALLRPQGAGAKELSALDVATTEELEADGSLRKATYSQRPDGDLFTDLTLERDGDGWRVHGKY